jgi:hypothetical protein
MPRKCPEPEHAPPAKAAPVRAVVSSATMLYMRFMSASKPITSRETWAAREHGRELAHDRGSADRASGQSPPSQR